MRQHMTRHVGHATRLRVRRAAFAIGEEAGGFVFRFTFFSSGHSEDGRLSEDTALRLELNACRHCVSTWPTQLRLPAGYVRWMDMVVYIKQCIRTSFC